MSRDTHVSIVSHNQWPMVKDLIEDLGRCSFANRLQLTFTENVPEDGARTAEASLPLRIVRNDKPKGFAENHNHAFTQAPLPEDRRYFVVLNPDVRINGPLFQPLVNELADNPDCGVVAPLVLDTAGRVEDSARYLPTFTRLLGKVFGAQGRWPINRSNRNMEPDWVAGMFMLFPSAVFSEIRGFDSRYFLYYEDVDICSRLWLAGYKVRVLGDISITHSAQRSSRSNLKYAWLHSRSVLRFLSSRTYRATKAYHRRRHKDLAIGD